MPISWSTCRPTGYDREAFRRRVRRRLQDDPPRDVWIASAEDVILRKLLWYRMGREVSDRQWCDVLGVLKVQGPGVDRAYLRTWARPLEVADLLERVLLEADTL